MRVDDKYLQSMVIFGFFTSEAKFRKKFILAAKCSGIFQTGAYLTRAVSIPSHNDPKVKICLLSGEMLQRSGSNTLLSGSVMGLEDQKSGKFRVRYKSTADENEERNCSHSAAAILAVNSRQMLGKREEEGNVAN